MDRTTFIENTDARVKLVRAEFDLTQEKMALLLGLSKKTLVEIEKGRSTLGWTGAVALCTIFSESEVLQNAFGGDLAGLIQALAFRELPARPIKTMGGKVWWRTIRTGAGWRVQQNYISQHFRILDDGDHRLFSSFDMEQIDAFLAMYVLK